MSDIQKINGDSKETKLFSIIAMVFVATLLISNIAAQKLFVFGPVIFTAGVIVFPITYIFGDVLTEVYGYNRTKRVIWTGFFCNILLAGVLWIAIILPPAQGWPLQKEFEQVLGLVPRIVFASILGYWAGEFTNSYIMAKVKILTKGKWLPLRTITSTIGGQFIDTAIFVLVAFLFVFEPSLLLATVLYGWAFKVIYEVLATPATVAIVRYLKKHEGFDHFDTDTNFNPFAIRGKTSKASKRD